MPLQLSNHSNSSLNWTSINDQDINGHAERHLFITHNATPNGSSAILSNPHAIGVWYDSDNGRWGIFNQDQAPMFAGSGVHIATRENTERNYTILPPPYVGHGVPMLATPFMIPGGGPSVRNAHHIGMWYQDSNRWAIFNQDRSPIPLGAAFYVFPGEIRFTADWHWHELRAQIPVYWPSGLDDQVLALTPMWNPAGGWYGSGFGVPIDPYQDYTPLLERRGLSTGGTEWYVMDQTELEERVGWSPDTSRFLTYADAFNVWWGNGFVHRVEESSRQADRSFITPLPAFATRMTVQPRLVVAQFYQRGGPFIRNDHPVGMLYDESTHRWAVLNLDGADMPIGATFLIGVDTERFGIGFNWASFLGNVHRAGQRNTDRNVTEIDLEAEEDSQHVLHVTPVWNPGGQGGVYFNFPFSVHKDETRGKWTIRTEAVDNIPDGAAFNYAHAEGFVHEVKRENLADGWRTTIIDHPISNGNPFAEIIVTERHVRGVQPQLIGVAYNGTKWLIFNQGGSPISSGRKFHVTLLRGFVPG